MNQTDLRVLHTLRCVGTTSTERLARATGLGEGVVTDSLDRLAESGSVVLDPGPFGGWSLTEEGRVTDVTWTEEELEAAGAREDVRSGYEQFLQLNPAVLQTCSDWQMRRIGGAVVRNDHDDPDYDATVLSRLVDLDDAARVICDDLAERLPRFDVYAPRMAFALERALAGETRYVADDMDSYHNVWFQLHEDLLTTLGLSRDEERRRASRLGCTTSRPEQRNAAESDACAALLDWAARRRAQSNGLQQRRRSALYHPPRVIVTTLRVTRAILTGCTAPPPSWKDTSPTSSRRPRTPGPSR